MSVKKWTPDVVIYHAPCADGLGAAAVCRGHFPDANYIPMSYGTKIAKIAEAVTGKSVLMVDFSLKHAEMLELAAIAASVVVLDHHKTAWAELEPFCHGWVPHYNIYGAFNKLMHEGKPAVIAIFDMDRSGAGMAWDWLNPGARRPVAVDLIEDRDLWRFNFGNESRELHAYIQTFGKEIDDVRALVLRSNINDELAEGNAILKAHDANIQKVLAHAHDVAMDGHVVKAVNAPYFMASDVGAELLKKYPATPFAVIYSLSDKVIVSLRSEDARVDVSEVAKRRGGGGHRNAAGFSVESAYITVL